MTLSSMAGRVYRRSWLSRPLSRISAIAKRLSLTLAGLDLLDDLREALERLADPSEAGELEDRRVPVAVDGDDRLVALHPDCVLHRPADAACDVHGWLDRLTGLPHLHRVRHPAGVADRATRSHGTTDQCRQLI